MQRKQTYFQEIAGIGCLFAILFAALFFCVAWLVNRGRISEGIGVGVIASYWIASAAYFLSGMCSEFKRPYRFWLGRMRLYGRFNWFFLNYTMASLFWSMPTLYLLSSGFNAEISASFKSYSIRGLIAAYGMSLMFCFMIVMAMIVHVVAVKRGIQCFKNRASRLSEK